MTEAKEAIRTERLRIINFQQIMTSSDLVRPRKRFIAITMKSYASATELSLPVRVGIGILTQ